MLVALDNFSIGKIMEIMNEIYDRYGIPEDLGRSIFIMLLKKPCANECEPPQTISLMDHITKLIL